MYNNNTQPQDSFLLHRPALPPLPNSNFINAYQQDVTHNRNNNTNTASALTNTLPPILPRIAPAGPIPLPPTPQTRPRPSRPKYKIKTDKTAWTADEDNLLRLAVQLYGDRSERWTKIAACVPGRTNKMCRKRWFHSLDPNLRKGPWTEEEDDLLRKAVEKHNRVWCKVAESIPGRTDDQCAKRWKECLDPDIDHTEWTDQEDALLIQKYSEFGSQWQQIAQFFQGRPGLHCRNRWRKIQRLKKAQKDPPMDMIIITPNDITTTNSSSPHTSTSSLSTTLHSTPQNVLQPNLQSNAQSTNNMQSNVQQQSNTQPHVQSRSSSIMSRQTVNIQQSHIHSNLQQQRLPINNSSSNLSANLQSNLQPNLQPNLQSNLQSNLQPNLNSKSNLSSNYVSNYSSKSNNNVPTTNLLQKMLSSNITNNSTSPIPSSIAPPSIENNTPDTMSHLPPTTSSSGGPTIASLLSSPSTSVSNNQMNLDILDDQGNSQPQSQPSQETEIETNVKAYGCGVTGCEVSFASANGLYYHMKAAHPTNSSDKPYRCALAGCSKKYKNINGLQYHIDNAKGSSGHKYDTEEGTNDTTVKPFKCPVAGCKNHYVSANGLQYHQKNVHRKDADKYRGPHKVNSQNNQRADDSDPQSSSHTEIDNADSVPTPSLSEQPWINNVSNDSNNQPLPVFNFQPQFNDPEILSFNESSNFKCCHNGCGKSFNTASELNNHISSDHHQFNRPMRQKRKHIIPHSE